MNPRQCDLTKRSFMVFVSSVLPAVQLAPSMKACAPPPCCTGIATFGWSLHTMLPSVQIIWSVGPAWAVRLPPLPCSSDFCPAKLAQGHPFGEHKTLSCTCRACGSAPQPAGVPTEAGGCGAVCSTCSGREGS